MKPTPTERAALDLARTLEALTLEDAAALARAADLQAFARRHEIVSGWLKPALSGPPRTGTSANCGFRSIATRSATPTVPRSTASVSPPWTPAPPTSAAPS